MKKLLFFTLLLSAFALRAQAPLGSEFSGNWFFSRAEIQEKPAGSWEDFEPAGTMFLNEFSEHPHFRKIPTHIAFYEGKFLTYTAGEKWFLKVFAALNDAGEIEFRDAISSGMSYNDEEDVKQLRIASYPLEITFINSNVTENMMLLQHYYYRHNEEGGKEGVVTIYYNRE